MSSIKCPHCGLVNFASAKSCKRCRQLLAQSRQIPERAVQTDQLKSENEDELASPLQLKLTGGYMLAVGLGCIVWGAGWLINGIPLRGFGFVLAVPGICFVVFSNSLALRKSVPRIVSRRG